MAKALLWFNGIGFFVFGLVCLVSPDFVAGLVGYELLRQDAVIEVRAQYGGIFIAIGGFGIATAVRSMHFSGLLMFCCVYGGLAGGRLLGVLLDGGGGSYTLGTTTFEVLMTILLVICLLNRPKTEPPVRGGESSAS